jgi:hypothetical protein
MLRLFSTSLIKEKKLYEIERNAVYWMKWSSSCCINVKNSCKQDIYLAKFAFKLNANQLGLHSINQEGLQANK